MRATDGQSNSRLPLVMAGIIVVVAAAGLGYWRYANHAAAPAPSATTAIPAPSTAGAAAGAAAPSATGTAATAEACVVPGPPPVPPRGAVADAAEMNLAHNAMQGYVNALESYQKCQEQLVAQAGPGTTPEEKAVWRSDGNQAIDQAHAAAEAFSVQLRIFNARH